MRIYFRIMMLVAVVCAMACFFTWSRLQGLRSEHNQLLAEATQREGRHTEGGSGSAHQLARARPERHENILKAGKNQGEKDPAQTFALLGGMDFEKRLDAIGAIISSAENHPERQAVLLEALRSYVLTLRDPLLAQEIRSAVFEAFAREVDPSSTDAMIEWLSKTSAEEKALFAKGFGYSSTREASGRWIEWMSFNLTPAQLAQPVAGLVEEWTQADYQSAGKWLAAAAESPAKEIAVQAYVEAVAEYEPHVAIQWAMTLPEGAKRDASLSAIHGNWPLDDPEGKTAFQRTHTME